MKTLSIVIIVASIVAVACVAVAIYSLNSDRDEGGMSFVVDEDDVDICRSETSKRAAMGSYDKRIDLFMKKALSDDDRDGDGVSTLDNCLSALRDACPSGTAFPSFVLSYLRENIAYVSDEELYSSFDWAAYPIETLYLRRGDCEDLVILFVALMERGGYDCGMALFHDHALALVAMECDASTELDGFSPLSVEGEGRTYCTFETTVDCPPSIHSKNILLLTFYL